MKLILFLPLFFVLLISACATTEEQKPAAPAAQSSAAAPATAPATPPIDRPAVAGTPTTPTRPSASAPGRIGAPSKNSVYFDYDQYDIKPEFRSVVEDNAKYLRENAALKARIEGNADERGGREYNIALGQRRAEAVMKALSLLGVPASRMEAISYGEEKPRRTGHDEASWAENRRGDLVFEAGK